MHYGDLVRRHAVRTPNRAAVIDRGRQFSYAELNERMDRLAGSLAARGVCRGDRVAVLADNGHAPLELMLAATRLRAIYTPIDFRLSAADILAILEDCQPRMVLVGPRHRKVVESIRARAQFVSIWVTSAETPIKGYEPLERLLESPCEPVVDNQPAYDDPFCILYTSGTTGRAKGVVLRHRETLHNGLALAKAYGIDDQTRYLISFPYSATGAVNHGYGPTLMMGGTIVFDDVLNFNAERWFATVERNRVTHNQLVPTMLFRILDSPARGQFDLSSLRAVGYGSASLPVARVKQMVSQFGPILIQAYGMTETCSLATILDPSEHQTAGTPREHILASCGRPVAGVRARIVNDRGEDQAVGAVGEIILQGPWFTPGYWNSPQQTSALLQDGWLYTGDIGRMDESEYLYVVDRKKDIIITGGANVSSVEVEAVIYTHPDILEVAVIGVPDDDWGERVHAVVVGREGRTIDSAALIAYCKAQLTSYKCPKTIEVIEEMPTTSTGKPAKRLLRDGRR